jgi:hypothetical protein
MNEFDVNKRERLLPSVNPDRPVSGIYHTIVFPAGATQTRQFNNFGDRTKYCVVVLDPSIYTHDGADVHFTMDGATPKPGSGMTGFPQDIGHFMNRNTRYYFDISTMKQIKFRNKPTAGEPARLIMWEMTI